MEICRLCLIVTKTNKVLNNDELVNRIKECVSIEISQNETYSKQVCDICLEKTNNWYEFKTMCLKSKTILENRQPENLVSLDYQNCESDIVEHDYKTRRNSVIMKRESIPLHTTFHEQIVNIVEAKKEDFTISFEHLEYTDKLEEFDVKSIFSESRDDDEQPMIDTAINNLEYKQYSCEFCCKGFEYYTDYLDHQNDHNGEAIFHCAKCKMTFLSKLELAQHEKTHKIPCKICGTQVQKQSMKLHLNKHTDKFKCTYCSLTFTCGPLLKEHIARHKNLKLHFCEVCGKNFSTKSSLVLHLKIHSDERQYKCEKCEYAGRTSVSLRIHMSKHETNTCICEHCSKIFKSNRNLYDHLKRVHCSVKRHTCEFCGMKFALRYLVEQHKRTHTGIHPYKCKKCFKTFARSDGLKEHMKTHNRTEMFSCSACSKNFLTLRGIKRHNCSMQ